VVTIDQRSAELLAAAADPEKAGPMAAYMKSSAPFYGVMAKQRNTVVAELVREFPANSSKEYAARVRSLWAGSFREDRYVAISYARSFPRFITISNLRMYRTMIVQGSWWDYVDEIASHLVGSVLMVQPDLTTPRVAAWIGDEDLWLRRTSIICQLRRKSSTDVELLDQACTQNLTDPDFFIRKAIGWALREYAKTEPRWVLAYVQEHRDHLSGLTLREATKHLNV